MNAKEIEQIDKELQTFYNYLVNYPADPDLAGTVLQSADRDTMTDRLDKKGDDGLREYERQHNLVSLDGLPTGLPVA